MIVHLSRILLLCVVITLPAEAQESVRLALLIGNQTYTENVGALRNPHHDIATVGKALEADGFTITTVRDAGRRQVLNAVQYFAAELAKGRAGSDRVLLLFRSWCLASR